jgi:hypothetical protein
MKREGRPGEERPAINSVDHSERSNGVCPIVRALEQRLKHARRRLRCDQELMREVRAGVEVDRAVAAYHRRVELDDWPVFEIPKRRAA